ncbi:MAG: lipoprotein [Gammaproteobacteria bacterium]|nr:lipoprotein [Pseudomonadales bacterium]MCP5347519.1 lipoprotein [Pseudomonadales bacterium]
MTRLTQCLVLVTVTAALLGCGQKGPLRRPEAGNLVQTPAARLVALNTSR